MFSADYTPWFLIFSPLYIPFEFPILPFPADFNLLKNQLMPFFNFFFLWQAISLQAQHVISLWFRCECSFAGHDFGVAFRFVTRARARRRPPPVITKFKALGLGIAVGSFQKTVSGIDLGKVLTILVGGLEVWNMNFIFPYIGKNHPNWLSYFQRVVPGFMYVDNHSFKGSLSTKMGVMTPWFYPCITNPICTPE